MLLKDTCELAAEILDGKHDADLDFIRAAAQARLKAMFRKGAKVRMKGARKHDELNGKVGTIVKVNQRTVVVGFGEKDEWGFWAEGEYNVPPAMLEAVS